MSAVAGSTSPRQHPAHQILDHGLRQRAVDIVVCHLVPDPVGTPAKCQLRQVPGTHHQAAALIGETEQLVSARARLYILESHVIYRLALGEGMFKSASIWRAIGLMSISPR